MRQFIYEARDDDGALVSGTIAAKDRTQAGSVLSQKGLFVIRIRSATRLTARSSRTAGATKKQIAWQMWQMATMVDAGMALSECLDCLARQASHPKLRALLTSVSKQVHEGRSLSEAMQMHPDSFPTSLIAMTRASELTGTLSKVLQQSSEYLVKDIQVMSRIRTAMAYPIFMLLMCLGVVLLLLTFVLPKFAQVFSSQDAILPMPTRVLMSLSDSLIGSSALWLSALFIVSIATILWARTDSGRRQLDYLMISLPGIGPLFNSLHQSRAFRTLSVLLDAHVPLVDSIRVVQDTVPNVHYNELWKQLEEQVQIGERFASPMFASDFIEESVAQMVDVGDKAGKLDIAFARLASYMEERYNRSIAAATQMIEPVMILFMGSLVGFVALAMLLPLFRTAGILSK